MRERAHALDAETEVLVTGGAGFVGGYLAEALVARGCRVTALDDFSTGQESNVAHLRGRRGFRLVRGSVSDRALLASLMNDCEVVFHLAAAVGVELILSNPVHVLEDNILGVQSVLQAARCTGAKVLLASTSEIYGKSDRVPFREEDDRLLGPTCNARWSYSTSKAVGEYLALAHHRQFGLPVVIFRLFNTIGPRQSGRYGMVVPRFADQAIRGEPVTVYGSGRQTRSFCDVRDAVRAIIGLAECPAAIGEVVNVGSTDEVTIADLARLVLRLANPEKLRGSRLEDRVVLVPYDEAYAPGFEDMLRRVPDLEKHRRLTGWRPEIPLEETLTEVIEERRRRLELEVGAWLEPGVGPGSRVDAERRG